MAKTDPYFQFPMSMFRRATSTEQICQDIVRYSLWNFALSLHEDEGRESVMAISEEYKPACPGFKDSNYHHHMVRAAAHRLNVQIGSIESTVECGIRLHEQNPKVGTQCRLRCDILWDAIKEEWLLSRFRVLCAVMAAIGSRDAVRISRERIRTLATGYNSPKEATKRQPIMGDGTVKHWLDKLRKQNIFRVCKCGKFTWYSIRHESNGALARAVAASISVSDDDLPDAMNLDPH